MSDNHEHAVTRGGPSSPIHRAVSKPGTLDRPHEAEKFTPLTAWRAIRLWWKTAVPVGLVCAAAAGAVVWWMFTPTYESLAVVEVREQMPWIVFRDAQSGGGQGYVLSQVEFMRSPVVLNRVLQSPEVTQAPELRKEPIPLDWIRKVLAVKAAPNSELVEVRCATTEPATAAAVANVVINTYLEMQTADFDMRRGEIVRLLDKNKEERAAEVRQLQARVRTLAANVKNADPTGAAKTIVLRDALSSLYDALVKIELDRLTLESELSALEKARNADGEAESSTTQMERYVDEDPRVRALDQAVAGKEESLRRLEAKAAPGYQATVAKAREALDKDKQDLAALREELRGRYLAEVRQLNQDQFAANSRKLQGQLDGLRIREKAIRDRIDAERGKETMERTDQGSHALTLAFAQKELASAEEILQQINKRIDAIKAEAGAPGRAQMRLPAAVPTAPKESTPYKKLLPLSLAAFCLPFGLAVLWERVVRRVGDSQQLVNTSRLRVLGEVATFPVRRVSDGAQVTERLARARSVYEESIDCLKTALILSEDLRHIRTIAVASAVSKEGKTSLASQLALSLARTSGERVLLIDGDLRSPDIHDIFEVERDPGVCGVLSRAASLDEAIDTSWSDQLHILPAGTLTVSPNTLLTSGDFVALVKSLSSSYRYVLIDTPPVLSTSEALILAKAADGVVMSTMREVSRSAQVRMAYDRLVSAGANLIGIVLNGVPTSHYSYKYGSYVYRYE